MKNEHLAIALGIARTLARQPWHSWSAAQADAWCQEEAQKRGVATAKEKQLIAAYAMNYVLTGGN